MKFWRAAAVHASNDKIRKPPVMAVNNLLFDYGRWVPKHLGILWKIIRWSTSRIWGGGEGGSAYERGGDARGEFWIKPLKETDPGVAQAFFDP